MWDRWTWSRFNWRTALTLWVVIVVYALLQGVALEGALQLRNGVLHVLFFFGATAAWLCLPIVQVAVLNAPSFDTQRLRWLLFHGVFYVSYALCCLVIGRAMIKATLLSLGIEMPLKPFVADLFAEMQNSLPLYAGVVALLAAYTASTRRLQAAAQASAAEQAIARSRFYVRRAQVDPRHLLDRLESIHDALPDQRERAERELQALATTLRAGLADPPIEQPPVLDASVEQPSITRDDNNDTDASHAWRWPRFTLRQALNALGSMLIVSLLIGVTLHISSGELVAAIYTGSVGRAFGAWAALPIVRTVVLNTVVPNWPRSGSVKRALTSKRWWAWLKLIAAHTLGFGLFCVTWVAVARGVRTGLADLIQQPMPSITWAWETMFEFQRLSFVYTGLTAYWTALDARDRQHSAEQRAATLATKLTESRLEALNARLDPHFLFNALNTLSSLMYEDAQWTRRLIVDLRELLSSITAHGAAQWSLAEEQRHLLRFVAFVEARFGDRIAIDVSIDDRLGDSVVPRFCLQSLVENAVKHNQQRRDPLAVRVVVSQSNERLLLRVCDNGNGFAGNGFAGNGFAGQAFAGHNGTGGLGRLQEILSLLHGTRAQVIASRAEQGGARVDISLPALQQATA